VKDILGYEGTRCVVVGAATGMGAACARTLVEMGAEVIALDIAPISLPVKQTIEIDPASQKRNEGIRGAMWIKVGIQPRQNLFIRSVHCIHHTQQHGKRIAVAKRTPDHRREQ